MEKNAEDEREEERERGGGGKNELVDEYDML